MEVNLVMVRLHTAFIDDSGTDPNQEVALATALVIPASRIQMLQAEWDVLRLSELFDSLHMSEFSSPTPPKDSDFRGWSRDKHNRVYERVREIILDYGAVTITFAVYKKDYDEVVPPEMRVNAGRFHYTWAVRHLLAGLEKWRTFFKISAPFEFVFDNMKKGDPRREEIEEVLAQAEEISPGMYSNPLFRDRKRIPGLQCVDVLSWISYQYALYVYSGKRLVPDAVTGWHDFEYYSKHLVPGWRYAAALKRSELERWVKLEMEQGLSKPFFDEWSAKKQAAKDLMLAGRKRRQPPAFGDISI
jgi:hypothetical protein